MKVEIHRNETSFPIVYEDVQNAYTKGPLYCLVFIKDNKKVTHKYPLSEIFRIVEDFEETKRYR